MFNKKRLDSIEKDIYRLREDFNLLAVAGPTPGRLFRSDSSAITNSPYLHFLMYHS